MIANDPEIQLLLPADDILNPEISIVVPALNEELTIAEFVEWCKQGIASANVRGEILIVDSSQDKTAKIAQAHGARVLKTPRRGLGRAYIDAMPFVRGKAIVMGDCDCTYDFRELKPFVARFREGYEFVMGSRFKGFIEPGAMPPLHRYLGTPVTTWILNLIYSSHFSDIHCGMRGISTDAFLKMHLRSQSWEYASEMVLKSVHMELKTAEVPIRFLKDKEGRLSHHKRSGWLSPWQAAWINLQSMFIYGPHFFLFKPGILLSALGLLITIPISFGPITLGPITFSLYWMLLGLCFSILGLQSICMGILAQVTMDFTGHATKKWLSIFPYNRSVAISFVIGLLGVFFSSMLVRDYLSNGFRLQALTPSNYLAVIGLLLLMSSFILFTFTLLLHATTERRKGGT
ncbi:glycosyltransferase family 2 protein [Bdellovibrionota bacterium FG-2]